MVRVFDRGDQDPPRFGFVVSRKMGGAVERNRIRRRWREVARSVGTRVRRGYDCVVVARPETETATFAQLQADLGGALEALGALSEAPMRGAEPA